MQIVPLGMLREIGILVKHELRMEMRNKYALSGLLLYVISTVFISFLSFKRILDVPTWNALFWIIMLFASVNGITKSFVQESKGRTLYLYSLIDPKALIIARIIYNSILMMVVGVLCLFIYTTLIGNLIQNMQMFIVCLLLGSMGFAGILTLISAIAARAGNSHTLTAILGFPILLPLLLTLIALSKNAIDGIAWSVNIKYLVSLGGLNVIVITLSFLLFPYLWRD